MAIKSQQLRQSFLVSGAGIAVLLVLFVAWITSNRVGNVLEQQADVRGRDVATRVAAIVTQYLKERRREVVSLASEPGLLGAVRDAGQAAVTRGLDRMPIPDLERAFSGPRQLGGTDPLLRDYLRAYTSISDFAEMIVTERHGFNVMTSDRPSDFVQSDETWWQKAYTDGSYEGDAKFDSSAGTASIEFDVAMHGPRIPQPVGVLKAVFSLDKLNALLGEEELAGRASLEVVDGRGLLLMSENQTLLLQPVPDKDRIPLGAEAASARITTHAGQDELVVSVPANQGEWWVVYREPAAVDYAAARSTQRAVWFGAFLVAAVAVGALFWLSQRLGRLRREVAAIRSAADEAAAMATEISASTEEMSASTEEMAATSQDLSRRAGEQAQLVRAAADDAARSLQIAGKLAQGAEEAARRNADLSALARRHKDGLDQTTARLAKLADEVAKGAA